MMELEITFRVGDRVFAKKMPIDPTVDPRVQEESILDFFRAAKATLADAMK